MAGGWLYAVSVDTETTGLGSDARVVQLAALRFRWRWPGGAGEPEVEFSARYRLVSLVRPPEGIAWNPGAVAVHGIRPADVARAPAFPDVEPELLRVVGDLPLVAHNAPFDRRMVEREFAVAGRLADAPAADRWACSMRAAAAAGLPRKLGDLAAALGLRPSGGLHDAGVDAELAALAYARACRPEPVCPRAAPGASGSAGIAPRQAALPFAPAARP